MSVCPSCGVGPTRAHWTTLLLELSRLTKENKELSQSREIHIATVFKIDKENARLQSELARLTQENYEIRQHCQRCADEQQRLREELARLTQQPPVVKISSEDLRGMTMEERDQFLEKVVRGTGPREPAWGELLATSFDQAAKDELEFEGIKEHPNSHAAGLALGAAEAYRECARIVRETFREPSPAAHQEEKPV